jgi:hypothetical protein
MLKFDSSDLVAGIKEAVAKIGSALDESTLREAGFAGAKVFREEAKRNALAHKKTGVIYNNIIVKRLEEESSGAYRQSYLVTVRNGKFGAEGDAFYWRFVERGHKFVPRNKKVSKKTGKTIGWKAHREAAILEYGTSSVPAYPFMRPAYDSKKIEADEAILSVLKAKIEGLKL